MKFRIHERGTDTVLGQVIDLPYSEFVSKFNKISSDPKINQILKSGRTDGLPDDEKLSFSQGSIPCIKLRPTQNEIGTSDSLDGILNNKRGTLDNILKGIVKFSSPVTIYNGTYIIDGHHRWSEIYIANPDANIPVLNIIGKLKPIDILKIVQMAIATDIKKMPTISVEGDNILEASEESIKNRIINNLKDDVLNIYQSNGKGNTKEEVANYIWNNVSRMQKKNAPITNAPSRNIMPQTSKSPHFDKYLSTGAINFINPKSSDVKENTMKRKFKKLISLLVEQEIKEMDLAKSDDYPIGKINKPKSTTSQKTFKADDVPLFIAQMAKQWKVEESKVKEIFNSHWKTGEFFNKLEEEYLVSLVKVLKEHKSKFLKSRRK